jgi:hypothetical protein
MITTRLAPIPEAQSTESNSVTSLRLVYQEAILDYFILEQRIHIHVPQSIQESWYNLTQN